MRSLFAQILLWFLATLTATLVAFILTAALTFSMTQPRQAPFSMLVNLQLEQAREAYEEGGPMELADLLDQYRRVLGAEGFLTDTQGRDLVTGEDRSAVIREALESPRSPLMRRENLVLTRQDAERGYWFLIEIPRRRWFELFLHPHYLWVLGIVVVLSYMLARHVTAPLRSLQSAVDRFGHGDLTARASTYRQDELGELARTFNRMAERIQTLLTAERRLLGDISHELRSPLARLSVAIELARSGSDREAALQRIQKEADRLNDLVSQLLQVTRAEGDPSALRREPVVLRELVATVVEDCAIEASARGCRLEFTAEGDRSIEGDPELLRRAVENVLRNAIGHAPEGTAVAVVLQDGGAASIEVRDFGPGVPEGEMERIFDPFYRVETDRNRKSGGAGLGLAIARRAVEVHGGSIRAERAAPGLRVRIELPVSSNG